MKTNPSRRRREPSRCGFTLVELMIVITIIALLAALTVSAFSNAQTSASRNRTLAYMTAIKAGLEQYKEKWGEYPDVSAAAAGKTSSNSTVPGGATVGIGGAVMLYQALTGDGNDAINQTTSVSASSTGTITAANAADAVAPDLPRAMIRRDGADYTLTDGFSRPFQYQKTIIGSGSAAATPSVNPNFDLWSYGNSTTGAQMDNNLKGVANSGGSGGEPTTWIKNW